MAGTPVAAGTHSHCLASVVFICLPLVTLPRAWSVFPFFVSPPTAAAFFPVWLLGQAQLGNAGSGQQLGVVACRPGQRVGLAGEHLECWGDSHAMAGLNF